MPAKILAESQFASIVETIQSILVDVEAIYLFGSMAQGLSRLDSDIDIAILSAKLLSVNEAMAIKSQLGQRLQRDIDLVDLRNASTEIAFQVITEGLCLFGADKPNVGLFEVSVMTRYADLQIERREIISDIVSRGRVYDC